MVVNGHSPNGKGVFWAGKGMTRSFSSGLWWKGDVVMEWGETGSEYKLEDVLTASRRCGLQVDVMCGKFN